jgi:hypothetical protein
MTNEQIQVAATAAGELVSGVSQEFRKEAFQVIFAQLVNQVGSRFTPHSHVQENVVIDTSDRQSMLATILQRDIDLSDIYATIITSSWVDRVILLLWKLENELHITSFTPPEIATVLTDKLRLPSVYAPNINRAITNNLTFFVRSQEGIAYKYSLSSKGLERSKQIFNQGDKS